MARHARVWSRVFLTAGVIAAPAAAGAASLSNGEGAAQTVVVTEGSARRELIVAPGETVEFCPSGCFVTFPNGDREALTGSEAVTLGSGKATLK